MKCSSESRLKIDIMAPTDPRPTAQEEYAKLGRSYTSLKGQATTAVASAAKVVNFANSPCHTRVMYNQLEEQLGKIEERFRKISAVLERMMDIIQAVTEDKDYEENHKDLLAKQKFEVDRRDEILEQLINAMRNIEATLTRPIQVAGAGAPIPAAAAARAQLRCKPVDCLRPITLKRTSSPSEYATWVHGFKSYYTASNFNQAELHEQHAYMYATLDAPLQAAVRSRVQENTPVLPVAGDESMFSIIASEFYSSYPLFNRRLQFLRAAMPIGGRMSDWMNSVDELGSQAMLHEIQPQDLTVMIYLLGCSDDKMRERLMRLKDPTPKTLRAEVLHLESVGLQLDQEQARAAAVAAAAYSGPTPGTSKQFSSNKPKTGSTRPPRTPYSNPKMEAHYQKCMMSGTCMRCGQKITGMTAAEHAKSHCKMKDNICTRCSKKGHAESSCFVDEERIRAQARQVMMDIGTEIKSEYVVPDTPPPRPTPHMTYAGATSYSMQH